MRGQFASKQKRILMFRCQAGLGVATRFESMTDGADASSKAGPTIDPRNTMQVLLQYVPLKIPPLSKLSWGFWCAPQRPERNARASTVSNLARGD
jgi:hypothetical protein